MNIWKLRPPPPPPHPPFDVIVLQLEPADEVMEDSDRGECLTLCPLKDSGVVEMKPVWAAKFGRNLIKYMSVQNSEN